MDLLKVAESAFAKEIDFPEFGRVIATGFYDSSQRVVDHRRRSARHAKQYIFILFHECFSLYLFFVLHIL